MRTLVAIVLLCGFARAPGPTPSGNNHGAVAAPASPLDQLGFLAGCWEERAELPWKTDYLISESRGGLVRRARPVRGAFQPAP